MVVAKGSLKLVLDQPARAALGLIVGGTIIVTREWKFLDEVRQRGAFLGCGVDVVVLEELASYVQLSGSHFPAPDFIKELLGHFLMEQCKDLFQVHYL
jgi:hypothetical protein